MIHDGQQYMDLFNDLLPSWDNTGVSAHSVQSAIVWTSRCKAHFCLTNQTSKCRPSGWQCPAELFSFSKGIPSLRSLSARPFLTRVSIFEPHPLTRFSSKLEIHLQLQESDEAACPLILGQFQYRLEEALFSGLMGSFKQL